MTALSEGLIRFVEQREPELLAAIGAAEAQGVPRGSVPIGHFRDAVITLYSLEDLSEDELAEKWAARSSVHEERGDSVLSDLVWSLACEQDPRYRHATFSADNAEAAFGSVYALHFEAVVAFVRSRFSALGDEAEEIAIETFSRMYLAYWGPKATSRIRGRSRLRSLLCTVARRLAISAVDAAARAGGDDDEALGGVPAAHGANSGADSGLREALEECLELLPPKRKFVAWQHWVEDRRGSEIADELGVGRPAVSNHLNKALPVLQDCLGSKGHGEELT